MQKIINPWKETEGYNCFGCSPGNPAGLHMDFYEDGDEIVCRWGTPCRISGLAAYTSWGHSVGDAR